MNDRNDEQVVYFKDLLFSILYGWKPLIALALVLAVALGAVGALRGSDQQTPEPLPQEDTVEYQLLEAELQYQQLTQQKMRQSILDQEAYLQQSLLMQVDPYNANSVKLVFTVDTGYQIQPGATYQDPDYVGAVLAGYEILLQSDALLHQAAEILGTQEKYAAELISWSSGGSNTRSLVITLVHPDARSAQQLAHTVSDYLLSVQPQVAELAGAHTVSVLPGGITQRVDKNILESQKTARNQLKTYTTALEEADEALRKAEKALTQPEEVSGGVSLKKVLLYAAVGGVLGAFLVALVLCVIHMSRSRVYSARTLHNRTGIKILGRVPMGGKLCAIDAWLRRLEGRSMDPGMMAVAAANARSHAGGKLAVLGSADAACLEKFRHALSRAGVQAEAWGNPLRSVEALEALERCDSVVLVEQCNVSRYADVAAQMELARDLGKKLAGCVLING